MDVARKSVLVVGLGKSGVASAIFLKSRGARVTVTDIKSEDQLRKEIPTLLDHGIDVETGGHGDRSFHDQDLIVVSPGVPVDSPPLIQARSRGEKIIGEIELASWFLPAQIVAITGSNGKTTTTSLTGEVLAAAGRKVLVGGNIGTPAISLVEKTTPETIVVLEVSSFQLETIDIFRPKIAAVLNISPDHLDRHGSMDAYVNAKARIFENQGAEDFAVLNHDDQACVEMARKTKSQLYWFSRNGEVIRGAFLRQGRIYFRDANADEREIMPAADIPLKGAHNVENVLAVVCLSSLLDCEPESIRAGVRNFKAVEHRLEYVATIKGVEYYNDSKATNVDAAIKAIESFRSNVHLILGGKDKDSDYTALNELLRARVKRVYLIGAAAGKIESHIKDAVEIIHAGTLENAVRQAGASAHPGDVVLLAPGCASFDQFEDYTHRGRIFKEAVRSLARSNQV
ncbi:MAG: UDP-N-acetylmuramoyl-L-alanine--D-glutamate ligase [Acidobacteriales bacterium]|nr:UDP-N-acetylmuramoyl-L-alanine--D-glutamate ligase [Terriglobales bacterium]